MSESADVAITTVTSMLIVASIVGNCLACAVIKRNRDMRIPFNYLLVNLAAADIMYSTFLIPKLALRLIFTHPEGMAGKVLCMFRNGNFAWIGATSSVITLVAIAFERYFAVIYPYGNKGKLTMSKLKVIIPGSWIVSLIFTLPVFYKIDFVKEIDPNYCIWPEQWMVGKAHVVVWNAFIFVSITLLIGLYSSVVFTLWLKQNDDNELTHQQKGVLKVRKRVTLMVVAVSVIFVICWGTEAILHLLEDAGSMKLSPVAIPIAHTMVMFNSAVNPFAYALINQRFKERMKGMLCCSSSSRVHAAKPETEGIEMANSTTRPKDTAGPSLSAATDHAVNETEGVELVNSTIKPSDTAGPSSTQ